MRRLFILFVVVHLVIDLGVPSAGAFRFNPDESLVALRAQPVQAQELAPAPLRLAVEPSRLVGRVSVDRRHPANLPDLVLFLPRRDPSADQSPPAPTEPA